MIECRQCCIEAMYSVFLFIHIVLADLNEKCAGSALKEAQIESELREDAKLKFYPAYVYILVHSPIALQSVRAADRRFSFCKLEVNIWIVKICLLFLW